MSAKLLNAFTDDNPDLHKQVGCMAGIFQMFDRHHLLTTRRLRKRLPSGDDVLPDSHLHTEANSISSRIVLEKNLSKSLNENQRVSVESSNVSFSSSSCSSSFSSLECSKSTQQESSIYEKTTFPERSLKNPPILQSSEVDSRFVPSSPCQYAQKLSATSRQSLDFRDVVKDSIQRETHSLSITTTSKEEVKKHVLKHKDSPRPLRLSESTDGSHFVSKNEKSKISEDLNKSIRVLAKLKEAPRYFCENKPLKSYQTKDGSFFSVAPEAPRFSYDGKEISRPSVDSKEQNKCSNRLRELPRLSLDSRRSSMGSNVESKSNALMKDLESKDYSSLTLQQDLDTPRQTSVVAKLMGLEAMPLDPGMQDHTHLSKSDNNTLHSLETISPSPKSLKIPKESKEEWCSCSPKSSNKDSAVPRLRPADPGMKPSSISRMPIEAAPWKQGKNQGKTQKMAFKSGKGLIKQQHETVYSEVGKKLKELEFQQTNKDLRALKQILDAIQAKGPPENKIGETLYSEVPYKNNCNQAVGSNQNLRPANKQNTCKSHLQKRLMKGSTTSRPLEAPIVIMKPAKSINKTSVPASSVIPFNGLSSLRKVRTSDDTDIEKNSLTYVLDKEETTMLDLKDSAIQMLLSANKTSNKHREENSSQRTPVPMAQVSPRLQQQIKDNNGSIVKTSGSLSPRRQQKKPELEKKSRPPVPSSDSAKSRKQYTTKHISDSVSPRNRGRPKPEQVQHNRSKSSEINSDTTSCSNHIDEDSLGTESNISLVSQLDLELTTDQSVELASILRNQRPTDYAVNGITPIIKEKNSPKDFGEDASAEPSIISLDQPSPVSVLDASFYRDDLPHSPVNTMSDSFRGDDAQNSNAPSGVIWKTAGPDNHLPNNPMCELSSTMYLQKLESIENLLQKLRKLSLSKGDESPEASHVVTLCEMESPDHRYVSEVLLASGLLNITPNSPTPIQLHKSVYVIDPGTFLALEQTHLRTAKPQSLHENTVRSKCDPEKLRRRLIFDTVNEILTQKLELARVGSLHGDERKFADRMPTGQQLLKEVSMEIERLQAFGQVGDCFDDEDDSLRPMLSEDMARQSMEWKNSVKEVAGLVLYIERSIFRDMISEVVNGEAAAFVLAPNPCRRRRQLFC